MSWYSNEELSQLLIQKIKNTDVEKVAHSLCPNTGWPDLGKISRCVENQFPNMTSENVRNVTKWIVNNWYEYAKLERQQKHAKKWWEFWKRANPVAAATTGFTIHDAASHGDLELVRAFLKDHPDSVFSKDDSHERRTPLHVAIRERRKEAAKLLLASNADVNARDGEGMTPLNLLLASSWDTKDCAELNEMVELLLANKADVNAKCERTRGRTPLHRAVETADDDMAKLLLANKADINAKDDEGYTPLHRAAEYNQMKLVELLLASKADLDATEKNGKTPLSVAESRNNKAVVDLLRRHDRS